MILSDRDILERIDDGELEISATIDVEDQVQPASIDLTLANEFFELTEEGGREVDPIEEDFPSGGTPRSIEEGNVLKLRPGDFVLGSTKETIGLPDDLVGLIFGRSSFGRLGVVAHTGAGFINPGWRGQLTLELTNTGPYTVVLRPGETRIIQVAFLRTASPSRHPYGEQGDEKYQDQMGPQRSQSNGGHLLD